MSINKRNDKEALISANQELVLQNLEKEKRALELIINNNELSFQNEEKGKLAAELVIANTELIFENEEKGKLAAELVIANRELVFENEEKGKLAAELVIANRELVFQNEEKGKRAAELVIANKELVSQNEIKEKLTAELIVANQELLAFNYISSHDLQEPLRKIQTYASIILNKENEELSDKVKGYINRMQSAAERMRLLIEDLLAYSRTNATEKNFEMTDLNTIIDEIKADLREVIEEKEVTIQVELHNPANVIVFQFRQLMHNLISNAIKFSKPGIPPHIIIKSNLVKGSKMHHEFSPDEKEYCHIVVEDNGVGFEPHFSERIFEVFQKLHSKEEYPGTGIGLAIVKKIVNNHNGIIIATGQLNKGAAFDIYIPSA